MATETTATHTTHNPLDLAALEGFTPGPWYHEAGPFDSVVFARDSETAFNVATCQRDDREFRRNAILISAAPALLSEVKRLRSQNDALRSALESCIAFMSNGAALSYAPKDWGAYPPQCVEQARAALKVSE